ncbi:peroxiredoxin [Ancylomarina sp. 16SWW S1-10-2]|uniref:peroxiredoxin family protein n=1 Tax=Ancylomarina sp. 16SWW S1-10-2 TaxID=2499681 RepID=UPI0012AE0B93|nr:thioredoxin-like domain-containing protein [Ancylomarina sp. 16SWW S1-10-2]MRT92863.1 redoxin domain-containing protein [Ancylomarina sp. 16SWW S1-10-2]
MRILLLIFLFISFSAVSQKQMNLSLKATDYISEQFYLQKGNDMGIVTIDSSRVKASGILIFSWEGAPGIYRLSNDDGCLIDFRMDKSDMSFDIKGKFAERELIFERGDKNSQFQYYISEFEYYKTEAKRISKSYENVNGTDKKEILKKYKDIQKEYKELAKDLWSKKDDDWSLQLALTYADKVPDLNQKDMGRFFVEQYFQHFDFSDSLILGTPCFYCKLDRFFKTNEIQSLLKRNVSKEIEMMVQQIFWHSEVNKYAQECLTNYLMTNYPKAKFPNLYASVLNTYKLANSCEYVMGSKSMRSRIENDKIFTPGSKVPDFVLKNCTNINLESLSRVNSDLTLLIAWSAHCEVSIELLDKIEKLYKTYNEKGFEVVAVSIDNSVGSWENFVNERVYTWVNACDNAGLKGEFAKAYNITATPSMFLISSDLVLVDKPLTFYQLKNGVKNYLH